MDYFVQFQINIFAILILAVLFIIMKTRAKVESYGKKLLKWIMAATAVAIIVEPLTWIFDGMQFTGAYVLEYSTNFLLFLMGPILGGLMLSYVDYHLHKDPLRIRKRWYYQHVSLLTTIVLVVNISYPLYFQVNPETNSYSSGDFKDFHYVVLAFFYIYMFAFVITNRKKTHPYVVSIFIGFFALPIIGMVVQLFESQLYFSWTGIVLAILVSYTYLESTTSEQDFLTKLYNRQSYEAYVQHLIELQRPFGILLIDLNHFKEINDQHGHHVGDQVLIGFSKELERAFHHSGLVARLGGDEFVVVFEKGKKSIEEHRSKLQRHLQRSEDEIMRNLSYSYGYQQHITGMTPHELYTSADQKMYEVKRKRKNHSHQEAGVTVDV